MAEKAIIAVLEKLFPLLMEELKSLNGVSREVQYIKVELEHMKAFLQATTDTGDEVQERVRICIEQMRDVAYDTEDVLEEFMLHLAHDHGEGCLGLLCQMTCWVRDLITRHQIGSTIKNIKRRIEDISEASKRYPFNSPERGLNRSITIRRGDALLMEEAELVGFEKPMETLIGWLLDGEYHCGVISVAGMGGLGKTTLVKKVYDHQQIKEHFQCHVWIIVSKSFKLEKLLKDMVKQLFSESKQSIPQDLDMMTSVGLKVMIKQFLQQKRYIIVFDDIWSIDAWEDFKNALPNSNCCSRVLVTTRYSDIASSCKASFSIGHAHNLEPLDVEKSKTLFYKKVFRGNACPPQLKQLSESILRRCQGLPLAIVTIGGQLAKENMKMDDWDKVNRSLGTELNKNESMMKILSLSYNYLPHYLKPCFLYLSLFPEDYAFKSMRLIRMWIAEGFVEEQTGQTLEEVGESYLNELINGNLIQVAQKDIGGRIRRCRVHDLIRDIILSKSREQNFGKIIDERTTCHPERIRRLSIHKSCDKMPSTKCLSGLRTLKLMKVYTLSNYKFFDGLRLLKVLDLRSVPLETFPNEFTNLFHLRYLCLRRSKISMLPNSIEKLQNLETLDLKHACVSDSKLPMGIFNLKKLRHLLVYSYNIETYTEGYITLETTQGLKVGREIGNLASLQKLCIIEPINQCNNGGGVMIEELGRLSQLRKLGIQKLRRVQGKELCSSIEKMTQLRSLTITSIEDEVLDLQSLSSPPPSLERLYIEGCLEMLPDWICLLSNLVVLKLRWSNLTNDPLQGIEALPCLVDLELLQAYSGESMCFKASGFKTLKHLRLDKLDGLSLVRMEEGTMPVLEKLIIARCRLLKKMPLGIEHLVNLKDLQFCDMPREIIAGLDQDEDEDHSKISHIPYVYFMVWRAGRWHTTTCGRS